MLLDQVEIPVVVVEGNAVLYGNHPACLIIKITVTVVTIGTGTPFKSVGLNCHCLTASIAAAFNIIWPDTTRTS